MIKFTKANLSTWYCIVLYFFSIWPIMLSLAHASVEISVNTKIYLTYSDFGSLCLLQTILNLSLDRIANESSWRKMALAVSVIVFFLFLSVYLNVI